MKLTLFFIQKNVKDTLIILLYMMLFAATGCKKLVEVGTPTTNIDAKNVYTTDQTAAAVLTSIYSQMSALGVSGTDLTSIGFTTGLSSDELILYSGSGDTRLRSYYQNKLIPTNFDFWRPIYNEIYIANAAIEGISNSTTLSSPVKKQLLGEAKFIRSFCYFYLVNLYGDVPLVLGTDYTQNRILSRTPQAQVWTQILADLNEAKLLLSPGYLDGYVSGPTTERVRPTQSAATALLARCYLYTLDWKNAELQASEVINNSGLYSLDSLSNVFLRNSRESIWQLQPVNFGSNTEDAKTYVLTASGPNGANPVYLSSQLMNSFEVNDNRKKMWTGSITAAGILYNFAYKYKVAAINQPVTEYTTILRLGEQFLIRAEARAEQGNLAGARSDLNAIRERAWLKPSTLNDKTALLQSIYHERQVELFTEWGHRWLDLKRTKTADLVMPAVTAQKGGAWSTNWQLYPIPPYDILYDGNLTQNTGY